MMMRNKLILAGVLAALLPAVAMAQPADPSCLQSNHDSRVEGTVLGAVGGALIGGALGHGAGAIIGGVGGAAAGNAIAGSRNDPCPPGYYRAPPPGYGPGGPGPVGYGAPAFWQGAPGDIRQRIDFMEGRLHEAADSGRLNSEQAHRAFDELQSIRASIRDLHQRDNGLSPDDRAYIQARLDHLGESVHWMEKTGY
jgi:hypothetical protein